MAMIKERVHKYCTTYQVMIRRKGCPTFCLTFDDYDEAKEWILEHEPKYVANPDKYIKIMEKRRRYALRQRGWNE